MTRPLNKCLRRDSSIVVAVGMADEWHVVGKKGSRTEKGLGTHALQSSAQPSHSHDPSTIQNAMLAVDLPGWGYTDGHSKCSSRQRKLRRERTPEEKVAKLVSAVLEAQRELLGSSFWCGLQRCFAIAATHISPTPRARSENRADVHTSTTSSSSKISSRGPEYRGETPTPPAASLAADTDYTSFLASTDIEEPGGQGKGLQVLAISGKASSGSAPAPSESSSRTQSAECSAGGGAVQSCPQDTGQTEVPLTNAASASGATSSHSPVREELCQKDRGEGLTALGVQSTGGAAPVVSIRGCRGSWSRGGASAESEPLQGLGQWQDVRQLLIFGLGSLESGAVPRHQAALGLLLLRLLPGLTSATQVYDPVFTAVDCLALAQLGFKVLSLEEATIKPVSEPSLLFLPHCESEFTAQIMQIFVAAPACIASTAVLGNSFEASHDRWCRGLRHSSVDRCPAAALDSVPGVPLLEIGISERGYGITGAFNDMSLHVFPAPVLP